MSTIEILKEVSLELKNGTLGKDLELNHIEQLLEIGIYKLEKKNYFKNKEAIVALEQKENDRKQGAVEELKKTIKELEDSLEFYECDYCKFEQHVVDKIMEELTEHINKLNKRLKDLGE